MPAPGCICGLEAGVVGCVADPIEYLGVMTRYQYHHLVDARKRTEHCTYVNFIQKINPMARNTLHQGCTKRSSHNLDHIQGLFLFLDGVVEGLDSYRCGARGGERQVVVDDEVFAKRDGEKETVR